MSKRIENTSRDGHAVVIGGSIAGLLAARVLTDHFNQVTVVERDRLPESPRFRPGAPHARHAHGLLVRGQQIMESLFPGLGDDLRARGAIPINIGTELALHVGGVATVPYATDLTVTACSRPLLEHTIQRHLRASDRVRFREGYSVAGLRVDAERTRVTGVHLRRQGGSGADTEDVAADLVVDASGRSSRLPTWLADLGFTPPTETNVDARAGYATRVYRPGPVDRPWKALYGIPQAPEQSRGCIVTPLEADAEGMRWHVTLTGFNGDYPPTDEAEFLAFARGVPVPALLPALAGAEPLSEVYGYRRASNRLRHFEKLPRYLEGMLAVGDSVYALNPVYGQGMTVAALGALVLDDCLRAHRRRRPLHDQTGLARRFQRALARVNADPWQMATGQDMRWPGVANGHRRDPITRAMQGYFDRVLAAMTVDGEVAAAFARVQNMVASPATLLHPRIAWRVVRVAGEEGKGLSLSPPVQETQSAASRS